MLRQIQKFDPKFTKNLLKSSIGAISSVGLRHSSQTIAYRVLKHHQTSQQLMRLPCIRCSFYSTDSEKSSEKDDDNESRRRLPIFSDEPLKRKAPFLSFIPITLKSMKIRNSLDSEFALDEFVEGSTKAVQIVSDKLSLKDFDGLRGLVKDEVINNIRNVIESMTDDQLAQLRFKEHEFVNKSVYGIEITEQNSQTLVEILMVYHLVRGIEQLEKEEPTNAKEFIGKASKLIDESFFIANYKFEKTFSKDGGSDDDWTISHINLVNFSDEIDEQSKQMNQLFKELMSKKDEKKK